MMTLTPADQTILLVDDNPENVQFLADILHLQGYQVHSTTDGLRAVEMARALRPDLIILDIMMPDISGYDVCRQLQADAATREIPVVFLSALERPRDKVTAFEVGGIDYITKPFEITEIVARVKTHLLLRAAQTQLQAQNARLEKELAARTAIEITLEHRNLELITINRIGQLFGSSLDLDAVLNTVLEEIQTLLDVFSISCWTIRPESGSIVCMQAKGPGSSALIHWTLALGEGITGCVAQTGKSLLVRDTWEDARHIRAVDEQTGVTIRSMLSLPLSIKGKPIGVLNLTDTRVGRFTQDDLVILEPIAAAAATAIENARLYTAGHAQNARLQELIASKDKFFSIISHDLRSPFTSLLGFAQLLDDNFEHYTTEEARRKIHWMRAASEQLFALLENLLTWARIQRGSMEFHPGLIDLFEMAEENIALFALKAEQKHVRLTHTLPMQTTAYADYSMVDTVVRNLIANALKFTRAGDAITVTAQTQATLVEIAVADTGVGISADDQAKLFRIDVHHSKRGTAGETGTGLGLILCRDLVERNHGTIRVESAPGHGATFRFTLPNSASVENQP